MKLLNISTITTGHKIQLVREVRKMWGARANIGGRVAFYQTEDGEILVRPLE